MAEEILNEQVNEEDLSELLQIRRDKLKELQENGSDPYLIVKYDKDTSTKTVLENFSVMENSFVSLAGRIMSKRDMGKASFSDIRDRDGSIQLYLKIDNIGEDNYTAFKKLDIGDIIGIKGTVFRTHKGEISVKVSEYTLLAKSLLPLPEKWHGLKDLDLRYRQRYVDLIVNPEVKETFIKRSQIIKEIRAFLDERGYIEVETPVLNTIAGGAAARPFVTHHNTLDLDMYLRIATELHLKRLIVGGMEKVYEIGRIFRNEGMSVKHNPEFTLIELYEAYTDYKFMMELTENLFEQVANKVLGTTKVNYQGEEIDLKTPWAKLTMVDAVKKYSSLDFNIIKSDEEARKAAKAIGIDCGDNMSWGNVLNLLFEVKVEEHLVQPTFIMDYPVEVSPLTKKKANSNGLTERFELFITRREMANAYSELNDPIDQKERFLKQLELRNAGNEEANMYDEDFINALEYGMPPTGGLGIGIDRLVMLLTDSASIRDVLLFPTMKPLNN